MESEVILKAVFPFLEGTDLAKSMLVCKQWHNIAQDEYFWKCLCGKRWPSVCKRRNPPTVTYYRLYQTLYKRQHHKSLLPPRLCFKDLEFYIDIWAEGNLIFSEVVPGPVLKSRAPPPLGICDVLKYHWQSREDKMIMPVEPRFTIPLCQTVTASVLVGRSDSKKVACIIDRSVFDYIDRSSYRALAFDYLDFSPGYPFLPEIRAWISLIFTDKGHEGVLDVVGIELDFCDAARTFDEVLWLLDILDWK